MSNATDGWHYQGDRDYLSHGGFWWRKTSDDEVTVIRIENLDEDSDKELEKCRFEIDQLTIDLDDSDVADALETAGWFNENPGKSWTKSSTPDRVSAMVGHYGPHLRGGGEDVIRVRGDEAAEATLEQWKAGVSPVEGLPRDTSGHAIPFKPATSMMMATPAAQVAEVPHGTVILYDRDRRAAKSSKFGALEIQFIDAYGYQRELKIARKYVSGAGLVEDRWESHAYLHPGLRHQAEISERVAAKLIERFWQLTTEHRDLLFNPDSSDARGYRPCGQGFVRFHTRLLLGQTPSATML